MACGLHAMAKIVPRSGVVSRRPRGKFIFASSPRPECPHSTFPSRRELRAGFSFCEVHTVKVTTSTLYRRLADELAATLDDSAVELSNALQARAEQPLPTDSPGELLAMAITRAEELALNVTKFDLRAAADAIASQMMPVHDTDGGTVGFILASGEIGDERTTSATALNIQCSADPFQVSSNSRELYS